MAARQDMCQGRSALLPDLRCDPSVQPPYFISQISETAMHRTIQEVYRNASRETRAIYDKARSAHGDQEENWIIRWMLWHVFRYRDRRNRHVKVQHEPSTHHSEQHRPIDGALRNQPPQQQVTHLLPFNSRDWLDTKTRHTGTRRFDPIRDI